MSVPQGRPKGLTTPPRGAASIASVGVHMDILLGWRERRNALLGAHENRVGAAMREQADGYDTRDLIDRGLERDGILDDESRNVEDHVAIVGGKAHAPRGLAAETHELARDIAARHRNHFDRQRK